VTQNRLAKILPLKLNIQALKKKFKRGNYGNKKKKKKKKKLLQAKIKRKTNRFFKLINVNRNKKKKIKER